MDNLYRNTSLEISKVVTNRYSTSFSIGIHLLSKSIRAKIYAIYGFVRLADEIVDTFDGYNQREIFDNFKAQYQRALENRISTNPVLNAYQEVAHEYELYELTETFLKSMEMDLEQQLYTNSIDYTDYIHGSAEVVGLMCLRVFVENDEERYHQLLPYAKVLGSAFQKVNFLRDIGHDWEALGRSYFPMLEHAQLNDQNKVYILNDIKAELDLALEGIKQLPLNCRLGVYIAYKYYLALWQKLKSKTAAQIIDERTRISSVRKVLLLKNNALRHYMGLL